MSNAEALSNLMGLVMSNAEALSVIMGFVMPFVISTLKQSEMSRWGRVALAVGVSLVVGFATSYAANQLVFSWGSALVDAAIVFGTASTIYTTLLEKTGLEQMLRGIKW